jgi:hypothetical protein
MYTVQNYNFTGGDCLRKKGKITQNLNSIQFILIKLYIIIFRQEQTVINITECHRCVITRIVCDHNS